MDDFGEHIFKPKNYGVETDDPSVYQSFVSDHFAVATKAAYHSCLKYGLPIFLADDIVNDVFVDIYKKLLSSNSEKIEDPPNYLRRCVANKAIYYFKKTQNELPIFSSEDEEEMLLPDKSLPLDKRIEIKLTYKQLCLHLTDQQKTVCCLLVSSWSRKEIAEYLEITVSTVNVLIFQIKDRLKVLKEYLD